jgi:gliding motility-associated-like protein
MPKAYYILFFTLFFGIGIKGFAQKLYWSEPGNNRIQVADLAQTTVSNTLTLVNSGYAHLTIDTGNGFIYYCNGEDINRADLATGDNEVVVMDNGAMAGYDEIAYSSAEDVIYASGMGGVYGAYKIDLANGTDQSLALGTKGNDQLLGVDAYDGNEVIYYADREDHAIYGTGLSGATVDEIIPTGSENLEYVVVDEYTGVLYYSTWLSNTYKLYSYNLNTGVTTTVASTTGGFGRIISIQPYSQFGKVYYVKDGLGVFCKNVDGSGTETQVIANSDILDIAIAADVIYPAFTALSPLDGSTGADVNTNLSMTFSEPIAVSSLAGTTNETSFRIFQTGVPTPIETIARNSPLVSISGTTVTINPASTLLFNTDYYILAGSKIFSDPSGNNWVGINQPTGWNFKTEVDESKFYSRQNGNWNDMNTWSHVGHSGPAVTSLPGCTGCDATIGSGHTVTMTTDASSYGATPGLTISAGATLNAAGFTLTIGGNFSIAGSFINAGEIHSDNCGAAIYNTSGTLLTVDRIVVNDGCNGVLTLHTDLVALNGVTIIQGSLDKNGFNICDASVSPPVNPVFTNPTSNSVTLSWQNGASDAFVVARAGSANFEPSLGTIYGANPVFGSGNTVGTGNFVIYKGTGTTVNITGLSPATNYEFDLYSHSSIIGGCYTINNYQFVQFTTCPVMPAPATPVNNTYCTGGSPTVIKVADPGTGKRIDWYTLAVAGTLAAGSTGGVRQEEFTPTNAGTYYAGVVDVTSGCVSATRTAVTLTENPLPVANNHTPILCESTSGTGTATGVNLTLHNATVSGSVANREVSWFTNSSLLSPVGTPTSASVTNGTVLYAKITNMVTQCYKSSTVTFTVNPLPVAAITGSLTVCANTKNLSFQATAGATLYTWTVPSGVTIVSGQGTRTLVVNVGTNGGGIIKVVPSNGAGCDGNADEKTIVINPSPSVFAVRGGGLYCAGGNGVAIGLNNSTAGVRYEIYKGANLANEVTSTGGAFDFPPITQPGVYTVKATAPSTCQAEMTGSATVTQGNPPTGVGAVTGDNSICKGLESTYSVTGISLAMDYQWTLPDGVISVSQTGNSFTVSVSGGTGGNISVVGNNECGRGGFASIDVTVSSPPPVTIELPSPPVIVAEVADFAFSTSGSFQSFEWSFGDNETSGEQNPSHAYAAAGNFNIALLVRDEVGCTSSDSKSLTVIADPGLNDNSIKNAVTINNVADGKNDVLYVERIDKFADNEVIVLDRWGAEVFRAKGYNNDWNFTKSGEYLPAGNYVCIVKLNESGKVFKRTVTVIKGK